MRRVLTVILLLAILAAAGWTLYRWQRPALTTADPWTAVPRQSVMVLEVPDAWRSWDRFTHTTQLWGTLEQVPAAAATGRIMGRIAQRMENDAALRNALEGTSLLVAWVRSSGGGTGTVIIGTPSGKDPGPLTAFGELIGADAAAQQALTAGGVVQVRPDTSLGTFSLCIRKGLWLMSSGSDVMDEVLLQLESGSPITSDPLFAKARNTLGAGTDAHVLVHTERALRKLNTWWMPAALERLDLPPGWSALDVRARPDALLMSGLLVPDGEVPQLQAMEQQGIGRNTLTRVLPATVSTMDVQHITQPEQWLALREVKEKEYVQALLAWVHGAMGTAKAPASEGRPEQRWGVFASEDPDAATQALEAICVEACDTMSYRGVRLTQLPMSGAHERMLGHAFDFLERPWWMVLGDVVLFSDDPANLKASVDVWNDGGSLAEDGRSTAWFERISESCGRLLWCDVARSLPILEAGLKPDLPKNAGDLDSLWSQLGGLSMQLSPGQHGTHHLMIGLEHAHLEVKETGVLWSTALGAPVLRKPDIVRNHVNNTREVFVQDAQHRVHLLGSNGKLLWTRQLDGSIMGAVAQVDRFRNGKLQLLFNTEGSLHLIDRNGKDVGGFPVSLKQKASAPMAVFDYDGERDYRVLVPGEDGSIRNFGLDGTEVKGWETPKYSEAAANPVVHVRIKNKDYLLVVDGSGHVNLLDRRGVVREKSSLELGSSASIQKVIPGMEIQSTALVWTDAGGALHKGLISGSSKVVATQMGGRSWLEDLGNDGSEELIRIVADSVIISSEGKPILIRGFGTALQQELDVYSLGRGRHVLGVVRPGTEQVSVIDMLGRELEGLPVQGAISCSIADLESDGSLELVSISGNGTVSAHRVPGLASSAP